MISFDLGCRFGHVFEIWFRSTADYADQVARSLVSCPTCGDTQVAKAVMAPNVASKGNRRLPPAPPLQSPAAPAQQAITHDASLAIAPDMARLIAHIADAQARSLPQSRWVGDRFAEEARAAHFADNDDGAPQTPIHGQASPAEVGALAEDGIMVMPLLVPFIPPQLRN